jgi:hypothetical protein
MRAPLLRLGIVAGLFISMGAAFGACLLPDIGVDESTSPTTTTTTTTTMDAGPDVPPVCMHATYPDPPKDPDQPAISDVVFAVRKVDLGEVSDPAPGLDLDKECTCFANAGDSCSTKQPAPQCDIAGGIDSATSGLFKKLVPYLGSDNFGSAHYSTRAEQGFWTILIKVADYNGTPNDPNVGVTIFVSPGMDVNMGMVPKWDGTDEWPVSADSFESGDAPRYVADGAYVADSVLVATIPAVGFRLSAAEFPFDVKLVGGVIVAPLKGEGPSLHIEKAVMAGRWKAQDLLAAVSNFEFLGAKLCTDHPAYSQVKGPICNARDILADGNGAKSSPCDSVSLGVGFNANLAKIGSKAPAEPIMENCDPGQDPADDKCL